MSINYALVPVRLDERDERVIAYTCGLEAQGVRRLLIVTAVESSGVEAPVIAAEVDRARERLAAMSAPLRECDMHVEIRVVTGDAAGAITALAHQAGIDVICMASEGKSVVDYLLAGSVSEDLVGSGRDRTMTVRYALLEAAADPASLARDFARTLVVPTDFSASSTRALFSAFERPREALGELVLLHVLPAGAGDRDGAEALLRGGLEIAEQHGVRARYEIREGDPGKATVEYLTEIGATGVITGRRGSGRLRQAVLGSVSMQILREAPCPVVVQP